MSKLSDRLALLTPKERLTEALKRIEQARRDSRLYLSLDGFGLDELPEIVGELSMVNELNLNNNQLTKLPESIGQLTRLQALEINGNRLKKLPKYIGQLTQLQRLYLDQNRLTKLPESIGLLKNLYSLSLTGNLLTELPESLGQLTQLNSLYLDHNRLTKLPESLLNLTELKSLFIRGGNKALGLPAEVTEPADAASILEYYFRTHAQKRRPLNEAKLILVGRGGVGKTSVVNRLIHRTFKDEKKTEGIQITQWPLVVGRKKDQVRLNVWDFGGQEIMHATHQFFLTERSLYLLVLSGR